MNLRPTHQGYSYQDLLTAIRFVDLALGRATTVLVDTKTFDGDLFDDLTTTWRDHSRERLQIKHTAKERQLPLTTFSANGRGLRLDKVLASIARDAGAHPDTSYRLVMRDAPPSSDEVGHDDPPVVLVQVDPRSDPGPALPGLSSSRVRFDPALLRSAEPWRTRAAGLDEDALQRVCDKLILDLGTPGCSLDIFHPGPAEQALLRRVTDELGAGRPPNGRRSAEDVALALIAAATSARSRQGAVTAADLLPRLNLSVDFGAVRSGHPVDSTIAITRQTVLDEVATELQQAASEGTAVVLSAGPGAGKSWLCEQLADQLRDGWVVARHHCWLGAGDAHRDRRVLTEVVIGSILAQLESAAPEAVAALRPRFAATTENLETALVSVRDADPHRSILLIVDGLDHVTRVLGQNEGSAFDVPRRAIDLLVEELVGVELPSGVVLLLAGQPGDHLQMLPHSTTTVSLPALRGAEVDELAERLGLRAAFPRPEDPRTADRIDATVRLVLERSRGNTLYATYLLRQAVGITVVAGTETPAQPAGPDPLDRLHDVPPSAGHLDEYYAYLLRGLTTTQRHVVSVLAVCDFAVSVEELPEIVPSAGALVSSALGVVAPIVSQQPGIGGLRVHHESFSRFVRGHYDLPTLDAVRGMVVTWLEGRDFFTDARAFRHLPEHLVAAGRSDELNTLLPPDFLSRATAGLQPPTAIAHVLGIAARSSAVGHDWPALVRLVQLRNAADALEISASDVVAEYADVLVDLLGADVVAASMLYDGAPTLPARWGLLLCAAVDTAGAAAPWADYLAAWDEAGHHDELSHDDAFDLAVQRGCLRTRRPRSSDEYGPERDDPSLSQHLADYLDRDDLPPLPGLLDVLVDTLGEELLLEVGRLVDRPDRRAQVLLHLADVSATGRSPLPSSLSLAAEACRASPANEPLRLLQHGVPVREFAQAVLGPNVDAGLEVTTRAVLGETGSAEPEAVERWLTEMAVAREIDQHAPQRLLSLLEGDGFYRAWLRFAVATVGLHREVEAGSLPPDAASTVVRVALEQLAEAAEPFTGRPRACDLWSIHGHIQSVLRDGLELLSDVDLGAALAALREISSGTTTTLNLGTGLSGPLLTTDLLALLSRTVGHSAPDLLHELTQQLRRTEAEGNGTYSELAAFELEMARVSLVAGHRGEALACWRRAARYMAAYSSHKDATIYELLDSLPDLASTDASRARNRLALVRPLCQLVRKHTNGRGTSETVIDWWRRLTELDPVAAADLSARVLLTEPGLEDGRVDAAHQQLLHLLPEDADAVVLAALRVAAGSAARDAERDARLLGQLSDLSADDQARRAGTLPVLANAITATYDDQRLIYAADPTSTDPDPARRALDEAARRLGGDGLPAGQPEPARAGSHLSPVRRSSLTQALRAHHRPVLPPSGAGSVAGVREQAGKRYDDDPTSPYWSSDALAGVIGWRLLQSANDDGPDAAIALLHRTAAEFTLGEAAVLADVALGLDLRHGDGPPGLERLASTAYVLAFTTIRGGGGWLRFAGRDRSSLWRRAVELDAVTAMSVLADQLRAVANDTQRGTMGAGRALVAAFAALDPDDAERLGLDAFACWDAMFDVIDHRLPGVAPTDAEHTRYETDPPATTNINLALARLAVATVAAPARDDRRRALVAATVLLTSRPALGQLAAAVVLSADLGSGPLTWLLAVLQEVARGGMLTDDLAAQLAVLAGSDLLSVRTVAGEILAAGGRRVPGPPATPAHPLLAAT